MKDKKRLVLNLSLRTVLLASVGCAALLASGCATVKRLNPWGGADAADAAAISQTGSTAAAANGSDKAANDVAPSAANAPAQSGATQLDLSVPAPAVTAGTVAIKAPAAPAQVAAGSARDNDTPDWSMAIQAAIQQNWLRPSGPQIPVDFSCDVLVTLTRSGLVEDAKIARSCGHATLDASVISAVQAASPLPLPANMGDFSDTLLITFTPR